MTSTAPASPVRARTLPLVWFVPLAALLVSGWLLWREFGRQGPVIEVELPSGSGLHAGRTPLLHRGVVVGQVQEVRVMGDLSGVLVRVGLERSAAGLAVEGSQFWLVQPEIGLSGVTGLDTLLSGVQLHVRAGQGVPAKRFRGLNKAPAGERRQAGRRFVLSAEKLGGMHAGAPVFYREVRVGEVEEHRLAPDATRVLITCFIEAPYDRLVRPETRFWNSGGISMKVGLLGAQVRSTSLESLVSGGVAFATPDDAGPNPAEEGMVFELHDEHDKGWLKWRPKIDLEPVVAAP